MYYFIREIARKQSNGNYIQFKFNLTLNWQSKVYLCKTAMLSNRIKSCGIDWIKNRLTVYFQQRQLDWTTAKNSMTEHIKEETMGRRQRQQGVARYTGPGVATPTLPTLPFALFINWIMKRKKNAIAPI